MPPLPAGPLCHFSTAPSRAFPTWQNLPAVDKKPPRLRRTHLRVLRCQCCSCSIKLFNWRQTPELSGRPGLITWVFLVAQSISTSFNYQTSESREISLSTGAITTFFFTLDKILKFNIKLTVFY